MNDEWIKYDPSLELIPGETVVRVNYSIKSYTYGYFNRIRDGSAIYIDIFEGLGNSKLSWLLSTAEFRKDTLKQPEKWVTPIYE